MNWVSISLIVLSILQVIICGFSFPLLLCFIGRVIFLLRIVGITISVKVPIGLEIAALAIIAVGIVFDPSTVNWLNVLLMVIFSGVAMLLEIIDDKLYLYITEDDKEE